MAKFLPPDLFLSYWLFTWFIIYYIIIYFTYTTTPIHTTNNSHNESESKNKTYIIENFNPKFGIILGLIENFIFFLQILTKNVKVALQFLIIIIINKAIPIYLLRDYPMKFPNDIYNLLILCIVFKFYLYWRGYPSIYKLYLQSNANIINEEHNTPMIYFFNKLDSFFSSKSS